MQKSRDIWFTVVDSERARLLRGSQTSHGSLHVDEVAALATTFAPGEHHRPDRFGTHGHSAAPGHENEEKLAHFAREIGPWLQQQMTAHAVDGCRLFATARMLGALRKTIAKALASKLQEQDVELAGLSNSQLAAHPRIKALLAG